MSKATDWWGKLDRKQQLIANELYEASKEFVATVTPTKDIDADRRAAFIAGAYVVLKSFGHDLPPDPMDHKKRKN